MNMQNREPLLPSAASILIIFMWLFTRLSALAMYLIAIMGITGALLMGARQNMTMADLMRWAFMPNPNHVANTNIPDIDVWKTHLLAGDGHPDALFCRGTWHPRLAQCAGRLYLQQPGFAISCASWFS